jgi:DNA polymerase-3 subunit delta'
MSFKDLVTPSAGIQLLQQSLARQRLGHAYLFSGDQLDELEPVARALSKTLNCLNPVTRDGVRIDSCDHCLSCNKIDHDNHPDVHWLRPESKTRIIRVEQVRNLIQEMNLKPAEAQHKISVIVAADRLKTEAANAFLKTLEEPPPKSLLILLSTEPQRVMETILSRCLRLNFTAAGRRQLPADHAGWLASFSAAAATPQKSLLGRYRLIDVVLGKLNQIKASIQESLSARSPLQQYKDAEKQWIEKWEDELEAAVEAEYRRQRADLLALLQWWLRDIWLRTLPKADQSRADKAPKSSLGTRTGENSGSDGSKSDVPAELLSFPQITGAEGVAERVSSADALHNLNTLEELQRWLNSNVQEALALEVALLKLRL